MKWIFLHTAIMLVSFLVMEIAYGMEQIRYGFVASHVDLYTEDPDPIHGLESFVERSGVKPYELFWRKDGILSTRVIFQDRVQGTEIWMLDNSPVIDNNSTASYSSAWNANGSIIMLDGARVDSEGENQGWLMNQDFSRLQRPPISDISGLRRHAWDLENPDIFFYHKSGELLECNVRTGEVRTVASWEPYPRERMYGLTEDNRYLFLDTPNGGMWVTYEPGAEPIPKLGLIDGRPEAPDETGSAPHPRKAGERLILDFPESSRDVVSDKEPWGPIVKIRVGLLIDRETGEIDPVIVPIIGKDAYLRAYAEGRIHFPTGDGWEEYRIVTSDDIDELFDIYRYYPTMTHGHESPSPDKQFMAIDATPARLVRIRDGSTRVAQTQYMPARFPQPGGSYISLNTLYKPQGAVYHCHWERHPRFFITWLQGWHVVYGDALVALYGRPERANYLFQVFSDGTIQPIIDTKQRFSGTYLGGDFSMLSPDATKVHFGSSMTGRSRTYIAVMARPRAPENGSWRPEEHAVRLTWEAPEYNKEIQGYHVYRSTKSGSGYQLMTPNPVESTNWVDTTVDPGTTYYYVFTSIEYSGLESGYSNEVSHVGLELPEQVDAPLTLYFEPETAIKDLYTDDQPGLAMGVDRLEASDWYYIYRHPAMSYGEASKEIHIPATGEYRLWVRMRGESDYPANWRIQLDGNTTEAHVSGSDEWKWVLANSELMSLPKGTTVLTFSTDNPYAQLDLICLTTDAAFTPKGSRPEEANLPNPVTNLQVQALDNRVNHLTWDAAEHPSISHYQVYASREPITEPAQEFLIGSPTYAEFIDWGLRQDTNYYYAVTAVDRRRNESSITTASISTPVEAPEVVLHCTFADADRTGSFELSEADATLGAYYVVPEEPGVNSAAWNIDIPRDGEYAFWLRYLHRGEGWRGGEISQNIIVTLDGKEITRLGGGRTDLNIPDPLITDGHPLASKFWTWAWPGTTNLQQIPLSAGAYTLRLENLNAEVRYDTLIITSEPSWLPREGRFKQN